MKISAVSVLLVGLVVPTSIAVAQDAPTDAVHGDPFMPHGSLTVTPTVVQPGIQPEMFWSIEYPRTVQDLAIITPSGELVLTDTTDVKVRVAGVSFDSEGTDLPVALWVRVGGGGAPWTMVFYGTETEVQPDQYVLDVKNVPEGSAIDFAARGRSPGGSWYETRWTIETTEAVDAITNGESLSGTGTAFAEGRTESFMSQFIDPDINAVLGPRDVLHVFELGSEDPTSSYFDLQDIVVCTTVGRDNNGHGNNVDGVDVSNPGLGNEDWYDASATEGDAAYDPDFIDDEKKLFKGKKI